MYWEQSLSGEHLKKLYTENKLTDDLLTHENLKTLLNYEMNQMGDVVDSDFDFEIMDFCVEKLQEMETIDEQKLDFLGQKLALEAREIARQERRKKYLKLAAAAASVAIIAAGTLAAGTEGFAGKFDLIHRLLWQDKGEQVAVSTPNMTLKQIEYEEGHLPEQMPDEFTYLKSEKYGDSFRSVYKYYFENLENGKLTIVIQNYKSDHTIHQMEQETNKKAFKKENINDRFFYYVTNKKTNFISWADNRNMYIIKSSLPFEILEDVLSFYEEEQQTQ